MTDRQSLTSWGAFLGDTTTGGGHVGKNDRKKAIENLRRKAYYRWEALRRTEAYRQAWEAAFENMKTRLGKKNKPLSSCDVLEILGYDHPDFHDKVVSKEEIEAAISCFSVPQFREQACEAEMEKKFLTSTEGRKLAARFGITLAWPPKHPDWMRQAIDFENLWPFLITQPVQVIPPETVRFYPTTKIPFICSFIENKRYINLKVDLTLPKDQIIAFFEEIIDTYSPMVKGSPKLPKGKSYNDVIDPFLVWDMIHDEHKTAWQVAKELMPDKETSKAKDNIRTLYKKAQGLILEQEDLLAKIIQEETVKYFV